MTVDAPAREPEVHTSRLFAASFVALGSTAVIFTVKADIIGDLCRHFSLTTAQLGWMFALASWTFAIALFVGGNLCDLIGTKAVLGLAFVFHAVGTVLVIYAPSATILGSAMLASGAGGGLVEAGVNPLIATLYPDRKTQRLNLLHASWPAGIVLASIAVYMLTRLGAGWQAKMWLIMIPVITYGLLFLMLRLPATERVQSGISTRAMYREALRPLCLVLLFAMLLSAAVESGPDQWIGEIMKRSGISSGILVLGWISVVMLVGRLYAGPVVRALAPTGLLLLSAVTAVAGLLWLSAVRTPIPAYGAAAVFALGTCWLWPTTLGIASERFPKGGAFLLSLFGGAGMVSGGLSQPAMGKLYQTYGPEGALRSVVVLPLALVVVYGLIWLRDRARGGYRVQKL